MHKIEIRRSALRIYKKRRGENEKEENQKTHF